MNKHVSAKDALAELNQTRAVVQLKGKVRIVGFEPAEDRPGFVPVFSTPAELKTLYANRFINVKVGDVFQRKPLFDVWLKDANRPTAIGVTIDPKGDRFVDNRLNLWQGYGVAPEELNSAPLLRRHIVEVVCAGNEEHADYLLRWIAWSLQNPTKPAEVVVVLRGRKGTGKGMLGRALARIFGAHALQISDRKHLVGSFNAHLLQVCFLFADEAFWPGDKSAEGVLKRMITEPTLFVEPKGLDGFEVPNRLSIMMTSNEKWVVPASSDERRYVVFDVADTRRKDFAYFTALKRELDGDSLEGFLYDMLEMDLGDWHPRMDIPETVGLAEQKAESAPPMVNWLGTVLDEGALPYALRDDNGNHVRIVHRDDPALARPGLLLQAARNHDRRLVHTSDVSFWAFLDEHGINKADDKRDAAGRYRRFPPLAEARETFREKYPWWPEFSNADADWQFGEERQRFEDTQKYLDLAEEPLTE